MITDVYDYVYSFVHQLADVYIQLYPNDEKGNLLMSLTDQLFYDFDCKITYPSSVYSVGHCHIKPDDISLVPLTLDSSRYTDSDKYNTALSLFEPLDKTISLIPSRVPPFYISSTSTNSHVPFRNAGGTLSFQQQYYTYDVENSINVIHTSSKNVELSRTFDESAVLFSNPLVLSPKSDAPFSAITNNRKFYDSYTAVRTNPNSTEYNGLVASSDVNGFTIYTDSEHSINDYLYIFDVVLHDIDPSADELPTFPLIKHEEVGEYYVGSVDSFDFDLQLPSITVQPPDFTLLGSATSYLFDAFSEFSLAIPLIFCIILTVIIKNVKG